MAHGVMFTQLVLLSKFVQTVLRQYYISPKIVTNAFIFNYQITRENNSTLITVIQNQRQEWQTPNLKVSNFYKQRPTCA